MRGYRPYARICTTENLNTKINLILMWMGYRFLIYHSVASHVTNISNLFSFIAKGFEYLLNKIRYDHDLIKLYLDSNPL